MIAVRSTRPLGSLPTHPWPSSESTRGSVSSAASAGTPAKRPVLAPGLGRGMAIRSGRRGDDTRAGSGGPRMGRGRRKTRGSSPSSPALVQRGLHGLDQVIPVPQGPIEQLGTPARRVLRELYRGGLRVGRLVRRPDELRAVYSICVWTNRL